MPEVPYGTEPLQTDYFNDPVEPDKPQPVDTGWGFTMEPNGGLMGANLRQSNPVFNLLDWATRPAFKADPSYDLVKDLKDSGLWNNDRYEFIGVQSRDEFLFRANQFRGEQLDRMRVGEAGWAGIAGGMAAGLLSPTMMLPLTAGGTGVRALMQGAALGAAGAAIDETALQMGQVSRPLGDTVLSIATSAVVGGALGRAVAGASKPVEEMARNIDAEALTGATDVSQLQPRNLSAASARGDVGGLQTVIPGVGKKVNDWAVKAFPNLRVINQGRSAQARWMMQQISNSGFVMEGNKVRATTVGGDVESSIKQWFFAPYDVFQKVNHLYAQHWLGQANPGLLARATAGRIGGGVGKYTRNEFHTEVSRAIRNGGMHDVPEVAEAAKYVKDRILDPMADAAEKNIDLKIPDAPVGGDKGYLHRVWDRVAIGRDPIGLRNVLQTHYTKKLWADFREALGKHNEAQAADRAAAVTDPEAAKRVAERDLEFRDVMRKELGAENIDVAGATAEFDNFAKERAQELINNWLMRSTIRLAGVDVVQGPRGPQLARMLDIETKLIEPWLENDYQKVVKSYVRTMAPDIELGRSFDKDVTLTEEFQKLKEEQDAHLEAVKNDTIRAADGETKLTADQKARMNEQINKEYDGMRRDLRAVIDRLRHVYGLPADANAIGQRLGTIAMQANVLRLMGWVVGSSISDPFRATMKYGLTSTFRDGFGMMVTNMKAFKMGMRETKLAGTGLDVALHTTRNAITDVLESAGRTTRAEKGLEYLTNKMGLLAGYDIWTGFMKQLSGVQSNLYLARAVRDVVEGKAGTILDKMALSGKPVDSVTFLNKLGIDEQMAKDIWRDLTKPGGGEQVNGVWMPNTEAWGAETQRAWRSALAGEVDRAIVTPGVERPLWMNRTTTGRIVSQFRSFGMSSTVHTVLAGLQARDAAALQGALLMLGMGAMSYYLYGVSVGGKVYKKMMNAGLSTWADEAWDRSGLGGMINDLQRLADHIPLFAHGNFPGTDIPRHYAMGRFGEQPTTRGAARGLKSQLAGPSIGGMADVLEQIITGVDSPTQSTVHQARLMLPMQNHILFRQGFDAIEDTANSLFGVPKRRARH